MRSLYFILLGAVLVVSFNNCTKSEFNSTQKITESSNDNGFDTPEDEIGDLPEIEDGCTTGSVCLVIRDNFERTNLIGNGQFAWSQYLDDAGRDLGGVDISIQDDAPASYGDKAVYFTGRPGGSVHSLYLISKQFDLTGFSKITIEFDYLLASFEGYNDTYQNISGREHLKVDLCTLGESECGLTNNESTSSDRLKDSSRWSNQFSKVATNDINQELNGKNHTVEQFVHVRDNAVTINLNAAGIDKSKVMLRWNVLIDEGFDSSDPDAGIVDNILVRAYK